MAAPSASEVTQLLLAWSAGDQSALDKLVPLVHRELRRLAKAYMSGERAGHTLQTTALVNEAYLRLVNVKNVSVKNRAQFLGLSAQIMKRQEPSAEVAALAKDRKSRLPRALIFSVVAGLAMPLLLPFPLAIFMLIVAGIVASVIAEAKGPPLEYLHVRQRRAEEEAQRLQEQYNFEAGEWEMGRQAG